MTFVVNLTFFLLASIVLAASASFLVNLLSRLALMLRMGEFVIAFILMAISTSLPELFVGINSALIGNSALSLGNVIGSNIIDVTLVAGIAIVLARSIKTNSKVIREDALWMTGIAALPMVLMFLGNSLSRIDGIILLVVFTLYIFRMMRQRKSFPKPLRDGATRWQIVAVLGGFVVCLVLLFYSSNFVVRYGGALSLDLGLPAIFVGLFFVAFGTSLPELVFETTAVLKKHPQFALGDIMGSVVANSTLVLGVTALISPISANFLLFITSGVFMIMVCFLFATFVESGGKLYWKEGISLIMLYVLFLIIELQVHQFGVRP